MRPWGEYLAEQGYAVEVPLLPGPRHHLAGDEQAPRWERLVRRGRRGRFDEARRRERRGRRRRPVDGRRAGAAARRRPTRTDVAGVLRRQPGRRHQAHATCCLPVLKRVIPSFPGIANDIKKPGVDGARLHRTPLKAAALDAAGASQAIVRRPAAGSPRRCWCFRSAEDHVVDESSARIITGRASPRATSPSGSLAEQLPRGHPRQRRPDDLRGVRRVRRPGAPAARRREASLGRPPASRPSSHGDVGSTRRERRRDEDERLAAIVDNYGDAPSSSRTSRGPSPSPSRTRAVAARPAVARRRPRGLDDRVRAGRDEERLRARRRRRRCPRPPPVARCAWLGLFGVAGGAAGRPGVRHLPPDAGSATLLVGGFVGGFVYLVSTMPRGPRDPGDDGARRSRPALSRRD